METFNTFDPGDFYDGLIGADGNPRPGCLLPDFVLELGVVAALPCAEP